MPITSKDFSRHKETEIEDYLNLPLSYYLMTQKIRNGLVKKLVLPLTISALTFNSCDEKQLPLEEYVPTTKTDTSIFNKLNSGLKKYLDTIYIIKKEDWENCRPTFKGFTLNNKIYLCENYKKETLYHEAAHIRNNFLDKSGSNFSEKWKKIARYNYKKRNVKYDYLSPEALRKITWKDGTAGPKEGCLDPYSGESIREDVATFVESAVPYIQTPEQIIEHFKKIKEYKEKEIEGLSNLYPWYFCNSKDKRYLKKLNLLKEYNFITNAEYDTLSKNLGKLNYLLKK